MVKLIHSKVIQYIKDGYSVIYIGKKNHPECEAILEEYRDNLPRFKEVEVQVRDMLKGLYQRLDCWLRPWSPV
jgi:4-hydroxy-3-methylbut-2-enyl diphosphate reductase IspH